MPEIDLHESWKAPLLPEFNSDYMAALKALPVMEQIEFVRLRKVVDRRPNIEVTPEGRLPAVDFLRSLDIFYYRSGEHVETFGRVVFEAMACALPVVCHVHGGYAEAIRDGENGFLFETTDQARAILLRLAADPALCRAVGAAARATVERMYAAAAIAARMQFYLGSQ